MTGVSKKDIDALRKSGRFDEKWYLEQYPDVKALGIDPIEHYLWIGALLKRQTAPGSADVGVRASVPVKTPPDSVRRAAATHQLPSKDGDRPVVIYESHNLKLQGAQLTLSEVAEGVGRNGRFRPLFMSAAGGPLETKLRRVGVDTVLHGVSNIVDPARRQRNLEALADYYRRSGAALVHANTLQNFHAILAAEMAGIPAVWNVRESEEPDSYYDHLDPELRKLAYSCFEKAASIIFVADATRALWQPRLDGRVRNVTINNGLDVDYVRSFVQDMRRDEIRASLGLGGDDMLVLNVGTVSDRKGQQDIVDTISTLSARQRRAMVFAFVGFNRSDYSRGLEARLDELSRAGARIVKVPQSDREEDRRRMFELYVAADTFVLTSRIESYPRVILEAMQFGLAIVSTPCFGVVEQLKEHTQAYFYEPGDVKALTRALIELQENAAHRRELGRAAHARLAELNSFERMVAAYQNEYDLALAGTVKPVAMAPRPAAAVAQPPVAASPEGAPRLSVLVVSRTAANVSRLLEALASNDIGAPFEVLCSWNGDPGGDEAIVRPSGVDFRVIEQRPYNFAKNNNGLSRHARGDILLFINDDVVPDRGAVRRALDEIARPSVGIVGINLRYQDNLVQHAGVFFRDDGTPFHRFKHQLAWDDPGISADLFVPAVTGAFLMIRRAEFAALKFDEKFAVAGEDIVLNLSYREKFPREILYLGGASALHIENATRKQTGERETPEDDKRRIVARSRATHAGRPLTSVRHPKVRIVTEKEGWIMHRKAEEIQKHLGADTVRINQDWEDADIHYYINYGYFNKRPKKGLVLANFTHFDPELHSDKFISTAQQVDHCIAVSEATADDLRRFGIPDSKISVILVGADTRFRPKLTVGVIGRVYEGGRKGEDLVQALSADRTVMGKVRIVAASDGWGVPTWKFDDPADFYRSIDYLLVPSRVEGGPVPFMEALACGTMAIAPEIGVIPQFPHHSFPVGDLAGLRRVLMELADRHLDERREATAAMQGLNWTAWATEHEKIFLDLLIRKTSPDEGGAPSATKPAVSPAAKAAIPPAAVHQPAAPTPERLSLPS